MAEKLVLFVAFIISLYNLSCQQCTQSCTKQNGELAGFTTTLLNQVADSQRTMYKEIDARLNRIEYSLSKLLKMDLNATLYDQGAIGKGPVVRSCSDAYHQGMKISGVYQMTFTNVHLVDVYCDQTTDNGGWMVVQRRTDGELLFDQLWPVFEEGFGDPDGEFWIGNMVLHKITQSEPHRARFEITDWNGEIRYADYRHFLVAGPEDDYRLTISGYYGTASDSMAYHNGSTFSTTDFGQKMHCPQQYGQGGWWYKGCTNANLNGRYGQNMSTSGITWNRWQGADTWHSFKSTAIKIRPLSYKGN